MTRALDGTNSWPGNGCAGGDLRLCVQQTRHGKIVTAAWTHSNAQWPAAGGLYSRPTRPAIRFKWMLPEHRAT